MSYQVGTICYPTELAAAQATAAAVNGTAFATSAGVIEVMAGNVTETSIQYILRNMTTQSQVTRTVIYSAQECQLFDWQDGLALGWGVAAAWIAAAVIMNLRRAAHDT